MIITAFCPKCLREVYVGEEDTPVCPVCSTPLLETVSPPEETVEDAVG